MVRLLDREAARHVYRVGSLEGGEVVGELGSLYAEERPGTSPLWISAEGTASTLDHRPAIPSPGLALAARWTLAPARWRRAGPLGRRARAIVWRSAEALRARRNGGRPDPHPPGAPAGFFDRQPGPGSLPLYAAVHPVTGDQLLSIDPWESLDLGYGEPVLLGYLRPVAPLTGQLGVVGSELLWASRFGQRYDGRRRAGFHARIDEPGPGGFARPLPFRVSGWALAQATVSRVELMVDGRVIGRARLGLPRPDLAARMPDPEAPGCGFECVLSSIDVPPDARRVHIQPRVVDAAGRSFVSEGVEVRLAPPAPAVVARGGDAIAEGRRGDAIAAASPSRTDRPNLLALTHDLGYGGAQLYLGELLAHLVRDHGTAATVAAPADGPLRRALRAADVPVHLTGNIPLDDEQRYEAKLDELGSWARRRGFSALLANTVNAFPGVELAGELGIPSLLAIHESFDMERYWIEAHGPDGVDPRVRARALRAISQADRVVFEAEATRRLYLPHGRADRLRTLPYGIELAWIDRYRADADLASARLQLGLDPTATLIACLGTFAPRKAQIALVRAFATVAARHPDAVLALVGEGTDAHSLRNAAALRDIAARLGLTDRVGLEPMAADTRPWHAAADLVVCASDVESLPRVVLEAMAFETPVLATDVFGLPEIVKDGVTGWLCEARDVAALADGLDRALSALPAQRRVMGQAGSRLVRTRHDAAAYAAQVEQMLRELRPTGPGLRPRTPAARQTPRGGTAFPFEAAFPPARPLPPRGWPGGRPRILIADAWLANAGDAAIALATDRRVRRLIPDGAVLHAAYQGDLLGAELPELDLVPPLAGLAGVNPEMPEMAGWSARAAERVLAEADVVLSQGGGFIMEHYHPEDRLQAWEVLVERGIPLAFGAQSIGSFREGQMRELLVRLLRAARAIGVREQTSLEHVVGFGIPADRVILGADEALSLFESPPDARTRRGLAVVPTAHPAARADGSLATPVDPAQLAELIGALLELDGAQPLTLLSSQQGLGPAGRGLEDDGHLIDEALDHLPASAARLVRRLDGYLPPHRLADAIGRHRALLSMRMHPALIGISCGTPTVVIGEGFKAQAMFRGLGLEDVLAVPAEVISAVGAALNEREPGAAQWRLLGEGRRRARSNDLVIRCLLAPAPRNA